MYFSLFISNSDFPIIESISGYKSIKNPQVIMFAQKVISFLSKEIAFFRKETSFKKKGFAYALKDVTFAAKAFSFSPDSEALRYWGALCFAETL
ncbi:MAG: hypothetical protein ACXVPY_04110 [Bacteroidia bacterium]